MRLPGRAGRPWMGHTGDHRPAWKDRHPEDSDSDFRLDIATSYSRLGFQTREKTVRRDSDSRLGLETRTPDSDCMLHAAFVNFDSNIDHQTTV